MRDKRGMMNPKVHISDDPQGEMTERIVALARAAQRMNIALSGGRTPERLFAMLAGEFRDAIPWDVITLFQVDERTVPPDHKDSNWRLIHETILTRVPGVAAYRMEAEREGGADDYERTLRDLVPLGAHDFPVLDLVILGMGPDGHTASLFPGTAALAETRRAVVRNEVPQLGTHRVTLTYPVLNAARLKWFLVRGEDRAQMLAEALDGLHPAGAVKDAEWFVDHEAARCLAR